MQNAAEANTSSASQPAPPQSEQQQPEGLPELKPIEIGGPPGPEPTRYGDWEKKGRCIDF
jgi:hypothetical protein